MQGGRPERWRHGRHRRCRGIRTIGAKDRLLTIWRHRGHCRSLAQVSGSYGIVQRLV